MRVFGPGGLLVDGEQQVEIDGSIFRGILQAQRNLRIAEPCTGGAHDTRGACGIWGASRAFLPSGMIAACSAPQVFFNPCPQRATDTLEIPRNARFVLAAQAANFRQSSALGVVQTDAPMIRGIQRLQRALQRSAEQ